MQKPNLIGSDSSGRFRGALASSDGEGEEDDGEDSSDASRGAIPAPEPPSAVRAVVAKELGAGRRRSSATRLQLDAARSLSALKKAKAQETAAGASSPSSLSSSQKRRTSMAIGGKLVAIQASPDLAAIIISRFIMLTCLKNLEAADAVLEQQAQQGMAARDSSEWADAAKSPRARRAALRTALTAFYQRHAPASVASLTDDFIDHFVGQTHFLNSSLKFKYGEDLEGNHALWCVVFRQQFFACDWQIPCSKSIPVYSRLLPVLM